MKAHLHTYKGAQRKTIGGGSPNKFLPHCRSHQVAMGQPPQSKISTEPRGRQEYKLKGQKKEHSAQASPWAVPG